ncbi:hypothetical protein ACFXGN_32420, partial [Streptomyces sp. NPDC059247]
MPENTVTTPLAPMDPQDVADAFSYIRALQADDIDTACAVIEETGGTEMRRLLLDVVGARAYSGTPWKPVSRVSRISCALVYAGPLG